MPSASSTPTPPHRAPAPRAPLELFSWAALAATTAQSAESNPREPPSLDAASLAARPLADCDEQAYLTLAGVPFVLTPCGSASVSPTARRGSTWIPISALYRSPNAERKYTALIQDKMHDALLYNHWLEAENYAKSTKPAYAKTMGPLQRHVAPALLLDHVRRKLRGYRAFPDPVLGADVPVGEGSSGKARLISEVYLDARDAFRALADKLGDRPFFFGDRPSSLDAVAVAHLTLHSHPSLSNPRLFSMLAFEFPTLIAYCDRVGQLAFQGANALPGGDSGVAAGSSATAAVSGFLRELWDRPLTALASLVTAPWSGPSARGGSNGASAEEQDGAQAEAERPAEDDGDGPRRPLSARELAVQAARRDAFYRAASVVGAVAFFVAFVVRNGIVQIRTVGPDGEEEAEGEVKDGEKGEEVVEAVEAAGPDGDAELGTGEDDEEEFDAVEQDMDDADL
ncbi:Metaxin-3 [Cladochytrium tenue]|nr:Metaxin-3 [Cladochytrium tenue]